MERAWRKMQPGGKGGEGDVKRIDDHVYLPTLCNESDYSVLKTCTNKENKVKNIDARYDSGLAVRVEVPL